MALRYEFKVFPQDFTLWNLIALLNSFVIVLICVDYLESLCFSQQFSADRMH